MCKSFYFSLILIFLVSSIHAQLELDASGNVGIGVAPSSGLDLKTPEAKIDGLHVGPYGSRPSGVEFSVVGECKIGPYLATSNFEVELYQYYSTKWSKLIPSTDYTNYIGYSNKAFHSVYAYNLYDVSDKERKENIKDLLNPLDIVLNLQGVRYDIKKEVAYNDSAISEATDLEWLENERKNKIGFIAQDVYSILPEVVSHDAETDLYAINYGKIVPVLVEAIKEQQSIIEEIKAQLNSESASKSASNVTTSFEGSVLQNSATSPTLFQNNPNPFNHETSIRYVIPEKYHTASINIYDLQGKQLKTCRIEEPGYGQVYISSNELNPGIYIYNLIVDNIEVRSMRMILTE